MAKKTSVKTSVQPHGGVLRIGGKPGNKGGTGRPPNWFKEFCADLLSSPNVKLAIQAVATDKTHAQFTNMVKLIADRGEGPVPTKVEGGDKPIAHKLEVVWSNE